MYADSNETTFPERFNAWIANRKLCDNIYSSPRSTRRCTGARVCAFFSPTLSAIKKWCEQVRTYRGPPAFSSAESLSPAEAERSRERGRWEKGRRAWEGINGIREIITVYIECNLAKRMQRRIEARLRVQGRAKWNTSFEAVKRLRLKTYISEF